MTEHKPYYPWKDEGPQEDIVYTLPIDQIQIPEPRVTSVFTPEQTEEFLKSLKVEGQKIPLELLLVKDVLWLADGLNRILGMRTLGMSSVKAHVKKGTPSDVQIANITTARNRGRENPAQTALVIKDLIDNEGMPKDLVRERLGISDSWFAKLYKIAHLPDEVLEHVKYARLSVAAAYQLHILGNPEKQISVCNDAVQWSYTEQQIHDRVVQLLNPDVAPEQLSFDFSAGAQPQPIFPKCLGCGKELKDEAKFVWLCPSDTDLVRQFFTQYQQDDGSRDNQERNMS